MEPPKIIREAEPPEGRGCWLGCFGIGCLVIIVGFVALLVGGWYGFMHTSMPLKWIEQGLEQDGKVKIEGMTGSIAKGVHIDQLQFLTVDDEHWSELRGIKFDYNGVMDMSRSGRFVVERMSVDSGTIYADIEGPDDMFFRPGDVDTLDEFRDSDVQEMRIDLVEVKNLKLINLDTDYSIEIENASLKSFRANGTEGIEDFGELTIQSNMLEAKTVPSPRWPDRPNAKRIEGVLRAKIGPQLKQDIDFTYDLAFAPKDSRQAVSLFQGHWTQSFAKDARSLHLDDYSPGDFFASSQIQPSHFQLQASRVPREPDSEASADDGEKIAWQIAPDASFQLGETKFQIQAVEGNRAPLRLIVGTAEVAGGKITAELRLSGYLQKGRIELKVGDQLGDKTDWANVIFGQAYDALSRDQQRQIEATILANRVEETSEKNQGEEATPSAAEAEDDASPPVEPSPPFEKTDYPESEKQDLPNAA
jgi:hypothetical protein